MAYNVEAVLRVLQNGGERVTSGYGNRTIYINGAYNTNFHSGIDLVNRVSGTDYIVAPVRGYVTAARNTISGFSETYSSGNYVKIEHSGGYTTEYFHMAKGSVVAVPGQVVEKGQILGFMGSTGWSTGNHLHFGIRVNGNAVDPEPYLLGSKSIPEYGGSQTVLGEGRIVFNNTPLYASSTASAVSARVSGIYYIWGSAVVNGRYRITNKPENIGKIGQVTGWVNASDIKTGEQPVMQPPAPKTPAPSEPMPPETEHEYEKKLAELAQELELFRTAVGAVKAIVENL